MCACKDDKHVSIPRRKGVGHNEFAFGSES